MASFLEEPLAFAAKVYVKLSCAFFQGCSISIFSDWEVWFELMDTSLLF